MKLSLVFVAFTAFSTSTFANDSAPAAAEQKIDDAASKLKGAVKKKLPKKDAKANEPSTAEKAASKKEEVKGKAAGAAGEAEKKADDLINSMGK